MYIYIFVLFNRTEWHSSKEYPNFQSMLWTYVQTSVVHTCQNETYSVCSLGLTKWRLFYLEYPWHMFLMRSKKNHLWIIHISPQLWLHVIYTFITWCLVKVSNSATLKPNDPSPYIIHTSLSGRHSLAPRANPPPTPRVPNAPGSSHLSGPLGLQKIAESFISIQHSEWKNKCLNIYLKIGVVNFLSKATEVNTNNVTWRGI